MLRPVDYLNIVRGPKQKHFGCLTSEKTATRDRLVAIIEENGLHRPELPTGVRGKAPKRRRK